MTGDVDLSRAKLRATLTRSRLLRQIRRRPLSAAIVIVLLAAATAAIDAAGVLSTQRVEIDVGANLAFYALPEIVTNLASPERRPRYLRLAVTLELDDADVAKAHARATAITAELQSYIQTLSPGNFFGKEGNEALRKAARRISNQNISPAVVRSVWFTSLVVD